MICLKPVVGVIFVALSVVSGLRFQDSVSDVERHSVLGGQQICWDNYKNTGVSTTYCVANYPGCGGGACVQTTYNALVFHWGENEWWDIATTSCSDRICSITNLPESCGSRIVGAWPCGRIE